MSKKKNTFGLSLKGSVSDLNSVFKAVDVSAFKIFEVSGDYIDWLADSNNRGFNIDKASFSVISVSNIIPPNIAGEVAGSSASIKNEFINSFRDTVNLIQNSTVKYCTADINLEKELSSAADYQPKVLLMKKLTPALFYNKLTFLLPVRIPSVLKVNTADYPLFARKVMNPYFDLALDIHPHEFRIKPEPLKILEPLRFKLGLVSFEYEPESGNYFVPKLLEPWLEALNHFAYNGPVLLAPRTSKCEVFAAEIPKLVKFVEQMHGDFE